MKLAIKKLEWIINQLNGGFVACKNCGDQEDTKTLDVMDDLMDLKKILYAKEYGLAPIDLQQDSIESNV